MYTSLCQLTHVQACSMAPLGFDIGLSDGQPETWRPNSGFGMLIPANTAVVYSFLGDITWSPLALRILVGVIVHTPTLT